MDALFQFDMNLQMLLSLQAYLCPYLGKAIKFSGISNRRPTGAYCVNTFPVNWANGLSLDNIIIIK